MEDQIFEIKFHNLLGYKFGRIVDEAHNLYNGDEGWATKDEIMTFMNKYLEALNKEHLRRLNIQKYKRCLAMAITCLRSMKLCIIDTPEWPRGNLPFWQKWRDRWLELAEKFKEGK